MVPNDHQTTIVSMFTPSYASSYAQQANLSPSLPPPFHCMPRPPLGADVYCAAVGAAWIRPPRHRGNLSDPAASALVMNEQRPWRQHKRARTLRWGQRQLRRSLPKMKWLDGLVVNYIYYIISANCGEPNCTTNVC
ncbi:hypothetical protein U9M48_017151 [Paspalum notatum var. saurae]|uniref:Uncharacterized protein n=1 Tax=Paspalum notatum var. saurae TaxID=547442 RepID=A0AAQ3T7I2_PASNO